MHVIERTEKFTLVGTDARRGKLTLFAEEGPREQGALKHIALRVSDLEEALAGLDGLGVEREDGAAYFDVVRGSSARARRGRRPTSSTTSIMWRSSRVSPEETARRVRSSSASRPDRRCARVEVGGAFVEFHEGDPGEPERPLLNHLAVLVDSAEETRRSASDAGIEVADVVDAPNTYAIFVWGPERVKIEYVEQKPTFALK